MLNSVLSESLQNTVLNAYLERKELEMIAAFGKIFQYSVGDTILLQGKHSNGIYVLIEGRVSKIAKRMGDGELKLETLGPGSFFGEISFFEKIPNPTSTIAEMPTKCLFIKSSYFDLLSENSPEMKFKLFDVISKQVIIRLTKLHDKIVKFISQTDMSAPSLVTQIKSAFKKPADFSLEKSDFSMANLIKLPFFSIFTNEEITELVKHSHLLKAPRGCPLIHEKDASPSCFIVVQGAIQSSISAHKKIAKLSVIGPMTLFASMACVDKNSLFTISFSTREPAIFLKFTESDLVFFQTKHPLIWYKLFSLISRSFVALLKSVNKLDIRLNIEKYNR